MTEKVCDDLANEEGWHSGTTTMTTANNKSMKDQFLVSFTLSDEIKPRENGVEGVLLVPHIEINKEAVESQTIDALMLVESAFASGEYHIYNCSCGEPPCAGLDDGVTGMHRVIKDRKSI